MADAEKNHTRIVVAGWNPHWMLAKWKLKYLKDPKEVFGGEESIHTIVRKDLKKDKPGVYAILDRFEWTTKDMATVMTWMQHGMKPAAAAKKWPAANPAKVKVRLGK